MAYASSLYANGWACQSHMRPLVASIKFKMARKN
jgi:hypothetical protein